MSVRHFVPLGLGMLGLVLLWLRFPHNYRASDPWQYALFARLIAKGIYFKTFPVPNIFGQRFGVLLPVAAVYALFGMTPSTTDLVPLLAGLSILFMIWRVLPHGAALPGVVCTVTCIPLVWGMTELFPDLISAAFLLLSVLVLSRRLGSVAPRVRVLHAGLGVFAWYCAMLAKESAWWGLPIWAGSLAVDTLRGRRKVLLWFHAPAFLFGLLLAAGYLWFSGHFFGDPLLRLHDVQALTGRHQWSIHNPAQLRRRLTIGTALFFWQQYGPVLLLALPGWFVLPAKLRIWAAFSVVTLLLFWFGSTSLTSYQPLPLISRMQLSCMPGLCIAAAYFVYWLSCRAPRFIGPKLSLFLLSAVVGLVMAPRLRREVLSWRATPDLEAMALVKAEVRQHRQTRYLIISAEFRTNDYVAAYLRFTPPANTSLVYAGELTAEMLAQADKALLVIDPRNQSDHNDRHKSYAQQIARFGFPRFFQRGNVTVFASEDLTKLLALRRTRK